MHINRSIEDHHSWKSSLLGTRDLQFITYLPKVIQMIYMVIEDSTGEGIPYLHNVHLRSKVCFFPRRQRSGLTSGFFQLQTFWKIEFGSSTLFNNPGPVVPQINAYCCELVLRDAVQFDPWRGTMSVPTQNHEGLEPLITHHP